jgi:hypothetical protein
VPEQPLSAVVAEVEVDDYIAIHAYVDPGGPAVDAVERARVALRDRLRVATTVGLGPRFLHSTGQLHKGGPPTGVFIQVVDVDDDPDGDVAIPGASYTFGTLIRAQAAGDLQALRGRGLRAARVALAEIEEFASS